MSIEKIVKEKETLNSNISSLNGTIEKIKKEKEETENNIYKQKEANKILKSAIEEKNNEISQLKHELSTQAKTIEDNYKEKINQLQISNQNLIAASTKNISDSVRNTCNTLLSHITKELQGYEYLIDKRIIIDILVKIFDKNCDYKIKNALMETMASLMELSNEDRERIGINSINTKQPQKVSLPLVDYVNELKDFLSKV